MMKIQVSIVVALLISSAANAAFAQQSRQLPPPSPDLARIKPSEAQAIATKVELPDLPEFTGQAKLEKGSLYGASEQVQRTYRYLYTVKDEPSRIIDWYKSALNMYKWDIDSGTNKAVLATNPRTGNSCSIYCDNENAAGCKLHISYTFMQKPNDRITSGNY